MKALESNCSSRLVALMLFLEVGQKAFYLEGISGGWSEGIFYLQEKCLNHQETQDACAA